MLNAAIVKKVGVFKNMFGLVSAISHVHHFGGVCIRSARTIESGYFSSNSGLYSMIIIKILSVYRLSLWFNVSWSLSAVRTSSLSAVNSSSAKDVF